MSQNDKFEVFKDVSGQYRWRLKAGNNETVATSEAYVSKQGAMTSAKNMPGWTSNTPIHDLTGER